MSSIFQGKPAEQTYAPNPQAMQQYQDILQRANSVASTPYQAYQGQGVAGLDPTQQAGIANVNQSANIAQPYFNEGADYARQGSAPIANLSAQDIQQYYSPYQQNVINSTMANMAENNNQQQNQLKGSIASRGALGGDRQSVLQAELARQQGLANNQTLAGLQNQGYQSALGAAQGQQQNQQQNAQRQFQGAQTLANIGAGAQNAGISGGAAQLGAGTVAQQNQQQQLDYLRNQFMQQQAFPYAQTSWLSGIANPTAGAMGGTTTGQAAQPGLLGQIAGLGLTGLGLYKTGIFSAEGGRVPATPYNFEEVSYVPAPPKLSMPSPHNFGAPPTAQSPLALPTGTISGLSGLKSTYPSQNEYNFMDAQADARQKGSSGGMGGGLGGLFAKGGLVHTIHALRHSIKSGKGFFEGGPVGGGDESLNPRNWLSFQAENGEGGAFPAMKSDSQYPSRDEFNFMDQEANDRKGIADDNALPLLIRTGMSRPQPQPDDVGGGPLSFQPQQQRPSPFQQPQAERPPVNESYPNQSQRSEDQGYGLLAAGLGMLGGTNQNALANIGQGGLKGLEAMTGREKLRLDAELKKQHADVEAKRLAESIFQHTQTQNLGMERLRELQRQHDMPKIEKGMDEYGRPLFHLVDPVNKTIKKLDPREVTGEDTTIPSTAKPAQGPLTPGVNISPPDPVIDPVVTPNRNETPHRNEEFLSELASREPNAARLVKAMADGRLAIPTGGRINPFWQKIIQDTAEYDPTFDAANYRARAALRQKMKSGPYADNRTSINTAMSHLNGLADDVDKLPNTGWFPDYLNPAIHAFKKNVKDEPFQELLGSIKTHRTGVADELAKLFKGTGASNLHDIQAWNETFKEVKSPAELKSAIKAAYKMINGRIEAMGETYNAGMGTDIDPMKWLTPQSRKAYERFTGGDYLPTEKKQPVDKGALEQEMRRRGLIR